MQPIKVLVACEFSGKVREAFRVLGHDAWSCDLDNSWDNSPYHYKCDVREILGNGWDLMIAHPPCTHLSVSGARHFYKKEQEQKEALDFVRLLLNCSIPKIALENPIGIISTRIRKPNQIIEPWMFGHGDTKSTCLWLKNLPALVPTNIVNGRFSRTHYIGWERLDNSNPCISWKRPSRKLAQKLRSITYDGIAKAMAEQWN